MKKHYAPLFIFTVTLAVGGCVDTVDSLSREYRNANNEFLDAMMMVTSETMAERMTIRIFKPAKDRYAAIDDKLEIVFNNRTKKDFVKETFESDSFHMYLTELEVNSQRFAMEMTRLRNLLRQYEARERELLIAEGINDPQFDLRSTCPFLFDMVEKREVVLETMKKQLEKPQIIRMFEQFPNWKIENLIELQRGFEKKREIFRPKRRIVLVN